MTIFYSLTSLGIFRAPFMLDVYKTYSVLTLQRTHCLSITKDRRLMFMKIIEFSSEENVEYITRLYGLLIVETSGKKHCDLKS
jgi:hypothetical protein